MDEDELVGQQLSDIGDALQFQVEYLATPGPAEYTPQGTRKGGGLVGDGALGAHTGAPAYSFRGDSFPGPSIETALKQSAGPGPAYNPTNKSVSELKVPTYRFGTEEQRPTPNLAQKSPAPNSYRIKSSRTGHGSVGDAPKFGFGTQDRLTRPAENIMRVAYVGPAQESENFGIFSPGPAAYSPRVMSAQANTQQRPPSYSMRTPLKCKAGPDGISLSERKEVGDGPGPGGTKPYLNRFGGGYMGDGPTHKIGTGVKIPSPAENLKKLQYYGKGFDRTYQGLFSPGPAVYTPSSYGTQSARGPSFSFGSAARPCSTSIFNKGSPTLYSPVRARRPRPPTKPRRAGPAMY